MLFFFFFSECKCFLLLIFAFFSFRFLVLFSRDENLLHSTFPVMFFFSQILFILCSYIFENYSLFSNYRDQKPEYKKLLDETTCTNKICSRQRAIVTGKAATPTMKGTVILFFLFLSFSFLTKKLKKIK